MTENTELQNKLENIRKQYGVTREQLEELGMDEYDYATLKERERLNYIKGLVFDLVDDTTDCDQLAQNIMDQAKILDDKESLQKIVLGELSCDCHDMSKQKEFVRVSHKIADFLRK